MLSFNLTGKRPFRMQALALAVLAYHAISGGMSVADNTVHDQDKK